jgi:hypothetical protein
MIVIWVRVASLTENHKKSDALSEVPQARTARHASRDLTLASCFIRLYLYMPQCIITFLMCSVPICIETSCVP